MIQSTTSGYSSTPPVSYEFVIREYPGGIRHMSQDSRDICQARMCIRCFLWDLHISMLQHVVRERRSTRISPSHLP